MAFNASLLDIPFLGPVVPKEVVKAVPVVKSVEDSDYETILNFTVAYLQGEESDAQEEQHWNKVLENTNLANEKCAILFTGLFIILRSGFRSKVNHVEVKAGLKALLFSDKQQTLLCDVYKKTCDTMREGFLEKRISLPTLKNMAWRSEVTITSSSMKRVMKPSVFVEFTLSDGRVRQFTLDPETFHKLRYSVSCVLRDMSDLEKAPILKIDK